MPATRTTTVDTDVLDVLARCTITDNRLVLPEQLDRKDYEAVNKVIVKIGGKWNRSAKAHLFPGPAADAIEPVLLAGTYVDVRKVFDAFYTPPEIADQVIDAAGIEPHHIVLEPSAGGGALAIPAAARGAMVQAYELRGVPAWPDLNDEGQHSLFHGTVTAHRYTNPSGMTVLDTCVDFLHCNPDPAPAYDRVIMNPPFSHQADMRHVLHAARFVRPGGRLVAIMSPAFTYRTTPIAVAFREFLDFHLPDVEELPDNAFKPAGTGVRTMLVVVDL